MRSGERVYGNSGYFNYVVKFWRKNGEDPEELLTIIHRNKHLHTLMKYCEKDLKQHIKTMKEYAMSRGMEWTETWRKHSIDTWRELDMVREELKLPLTPILEILNLSAKEIMLKMLSEEDKETAEQSLEKENKSGKRVSL